MSKIKKYLFSIGTFFTSLVSKVYADETLTIEKLLDPERIESKYGIFEPELTIGDKIINVGKFVLPIILFFIGLFVILNKKITNKVKIIVVSILIILVIVGYVLIKYFAKDF